MGEFVDCFCFHTLTHPYPPHHYQAAHRHKGAAVGSHSEHCPTHGTDAPLQYFCQTCHTAICADCAMFGPAHKGHDFEKLAVVYDTHTKAVRKHVHELETRLAALELLEGQVQVNIDAVRAAKEVASADAARAAHAMETRLVRLLFLYS